MADDRRITIEILGTGASGKSTQQIKTAGGSDFQKTLSKYLHPIKTFEREVLGDYVIAQQMAKQATSLVKETIDPTITRYLNLKEDYLAENDYAQIKSTISRTTGFLASVAGGAIVGAKAGPIGAVVGAAISGVSYSVRQVIQYQQKMSGFYQQLNATNMQTAFMAQRAGLVVGTQNTLG